MAQEELRMQNKLNINNLGGGKCQIFVAAHKPYPTYQDDIYTPIHVGYATSSFKEQMKGMLNDATGDSISKENPSYCELTALYWAWKNVKDADYIGLAHYRRYFEQVFTHETLSQLFQTCDVVLAEPILHDTYNEIKLSKTLIAEDKVIFLKTLKRLFPEYEQTALDYLYSFRDYPYNMFVMPWSRFEQYCTFLFGILEECHRLMRPLPYSQSQRRLGYIGEFLLPIFCLHNQLRIHTEPVVAQLGDKSRHAENRKRRMKAALLQQIYKHSKPAHLEALCAPAVVLGLQADGIDLPE